MTAYTNSLRLTLPVTGTDDGTWGETVNTGITSLVDASIAGTATVAHDDTANYTLTDNDGATDEARQMFLNITGTLTAARNVVCPGVSKLYFLTNNTTGGYAVTLKTSGGTGISIANGKKAALYCDGTNVVYAFDQVTLQPTVTISGDQDTSYGLNNAPTMQDTLGGTSPAVYRSGPGTATGDTWATPITSLYHYLTSQGTYKAGSVTTQAGFYVNSLMVGAQFNYAFYSNLDATASTAITSINGTGSTVTVESASHGLSDDDKVVISLVSQATMTSGSYNGGPYTVTVVDANTFTYNSSATSSAAVTSSGRATKVNNYNLNSIGTAPSAFSGPVIVSANSYMDALRITQTGSGNAFVVEDSTNPDTTPFVIDSTGRVLIGSTATGASGGLLQVTNAASTLYTYLASTGAYTSDYRKSRSASLGVQTIVQNGDALGGSVFYGSDGTNFINAAQIIAYVDGTPGTNDMPGRLVFSTTADGASSPTEAMRIDSSQNVIIGEGEASSTPTDGVLRGADGAGTNIAGADLSIYSGNSTGSALGGNLSFFTTITPGSSGTTANSRAERVRIYSTSGGANDPVGVHVATSGVYPSTVPLSVNSGKGSFTIEGISNGSCNMQLLNWGVSTSDEPNINFMALNSNTVGNYGTALTTGQNLGLISFEGYSGTGTTMVTGGSIFYEAYGGTWSTTAAPSRMLIGCGSTTEVSTNRVALTANNFEMLTGTGLTIAETAITTGSSAVGNVFSGTYTPSQVATNTNIATGPTFSAAQYMRVGNTVTVSGQIIFTATASATDTTVKISLPIASNFSATRQLAGTGAGLNSGIFGTNNMVLLADTANDCVEIRCRPTTTSSTTYQFTFTYQVI